MKINQSTLYWYKLLLAIAFVAIIATINLWFIRYDTNDDLGFVLIDYDRFIWIAQQQGRVLYLFAYPFISLPYAASSVHYISVVKVILFLSLSSVTAAFLAMIVRSKYVFIIAFMIIALLWQNAIGRHNLLVSYPYIALCFTLLMLYLISIPLAIKSNLRRVLISHLVLLLSVLLMGGEFSFQYLPFVAIFFYYIWHFDEQVRSNRRQFLLLAKLSCIVFISVLTVNIAFKYAYPSKYGGNSNLSLELTKVFDTFTTLTFGLFPGIRSVETIFTAPLSIGIGAWIFGIISALLSAYFLLRIRRHLLTDSVNSALTEFSGHKLLVVALLFISFISAPNFLISLTKKYQYWAIDVKIGSYVYSAFSYLGIALLFSFITLLSARKKPVYIFIILVISGVIAITQTNNFIVGNIQRAGNERWTIFDSTVEMMREIEPNKDTEPNIALSENFISNSPPTGGVGYWHTYALKKLNYRAKFSNADSGAPYFLRLSDPTAGERPVGILGKDGVAMYLITSKYCSDLFPCFLVSSSNNDHIDLLGSGHNELGAKYTQLRGGRCVGSSFVYRIKDDISRYSVIGFTDKKPANNFVNNEIVFQKGVYALEHGVEGGVDKYWRWVQAPAVMQVNNDRVGQARTLVFSITPAEDMELTFDVNGRLEKFTLAQSVNTTLPISLDPSKSTWVIKISSDKKPIRLNPADSRLFSFAISSMFLEK